MIKRNTATHLKQVGTKDALKHEKNTLRASTKKARGRKRREEIFFNPPYNVVLRYKLDKLFLKLIDKNFPINHQLHKIINCHTIKIS